MSKKRRIDDIDAQYDHYNTSVAPYQFEFRVSTPVTLSSLDGHVDPGPQVSQTPSRPAKKARTSPQVRSYTRRIDKTEAIMKLLTEDKRYRLGDFLQDIFNSNNYENLSSTSQSAVAFWLKGSSREGTRPAEIVDAIYRHPTGVTRDGSIVCRAQFSDLVPPAKPPTFASTHPGEISLLPPCSNSEPLNAERVNSRQGLEELMVRGTLHLVDREANLLTGSESGLKRSAGMTWDDLENISRDEEEEKIRKSGPVIWAILSTITYSRARNTDPAQSSSIRDAALARNALKVDTLLDDIDPVHLENAGAGLVMRTLLLYVPSLPQRLRQEVEAKFRSLDGFAIHRLRLRKSLTLSMGTSNINESTADGVSKILHDLVSTQMKMLATWFDRILILVGGDQLTVDRLRKIRCFRAIEKSVYESRSWAIPLIQLWHMKVAYLRSIFKIHWFDKTSSNLFGLRQSMQSIGRNNSSEFYPCHYAVKTVFEGMALTATYTLLQQDAGFDPKPTDSMLSELAKHFAPGSKYHECSLLDFEQLARNVYRKYMTTEGFHKTLEANQPGSFTSKDQIKDIILGKLYCYEQDPNYVACPDSTGGLELGSGHDDQLLGNMILFMRDAFIYLEMASAIPEGDIGRVFEVTKLLRFFFWGSNASNYGNELLEVACGFLYEYPEKLRTAILNNWLVNPSGLAGHWQECDFFQEHCNKAIKTVFNTKNSEWDSRFLRDSVSVNITRLTRLRDALLKFLGVGSIGSGRSRPDYSADINVLASHYLRGDAFIFRPGRSQEVVAVDMFHEGLNKLSAGALKQFLERTRWDIEDINPEFAQNHTHDAAEEDPTMEIPEQALVVEGGALFEEEIQPEGEQPL